MYVRYRLTLSCLTVHQYAFSTRKSSFDQCVGRIDVLEHIGVGDIVQLDLVFSDELDTRIIRSVLADAINGTPRARRRVDRLKKAEQ